MIRTNMLARMICLGMLLGIIPTAHVRAMEMPAQHVTLTFGKDKTKSRSIFAYSS